MNIENIIVIGGGGYSKVVISIINKTHKYNIIGYTSLKDEGKVFGTKYLGKDESIIRNKKYRNYNVAIGIGQIKNLDLRKKVIKSYLNDGFKFPSIVSPDAIINENVMIRDGSVIMDGVIINSFSDIGKFCIINTGSRIDHDCFIDDYVHIAPGSVLCGEVKIGKGTFIGAGSTIINSVNIGEDSFMRAGSIVIEDYKKI